MKEEMIEEKEEQIKREGNIERILEIIKEKTTIITKNETEVIQIDGIQNNFQKNS